MQIPFIFVFLRHDRTGCFPHFSFLMITDPIEIVFEALKQNPEFCATIIGIVDESSPIKKRRSRFQIVDSYAPWVRDQKTIVSVQKAGATEECDGVFTSGNLSTIKPLITDEDLSLSYSLGQQARKKKKTMDDKSKNLAVGENSIVHVIYVRESGLEGEDRFKMLTNIIDFLEVNEGIIDNQDEELKKYKLQKFHMMRESFEALSSQHASESL